LRKRRRKKRKKKLSKRDEKNGRKKLEKQEEKAWKDEIRWAEKAAKKKPRRKQADVEDPNPVVETDAEPESDLEPSESSLQSHEISNNECALCFGLYEDDISPTRTIIERVGAVH